MEFILPEYKLEEFRDNSGHLWQRILLDGSESLDVQGSPSLPVYRVSARLLRMLLRHSILLRMHSPVPERGHAIVTHRQPPYHQGGDSKQNKYCQESRFHRENQSAFCNRLNITVEK